jgi:hypothetical protein
MTPLTLENILQNLNFFIDCFTVGVYYTGMTILRCYIEEHGLKQKWLADKCGLSQPYFCQIVNGEFPPSPEVAARLQSLTGLDAWELMGVPKPNRESEMASAAARD